MPFYGLILIIAAALAVGERFMSAREERFWREMNPPKVFVAGEVAQSPDAGLTPPAPGCFQEDASDLQVHDGEVRERGTNDKEVQSNGCRGNNESNG